MQPENSSSLTTGLWLALLLLAGCLNGPAESTKSPGTGTSQTSAPDSCKFLVCSPTTESIEVEERYGLRQLSNNSQTGEISVGDGLVTWGIMYEGVGPFAYDFNSGQYHVFSGPPGFYTNERRQSGPVVLVALVPFGGTADEPWTDLANKTFVLWEPRSGKTTPVDRSKISGEVYAQDFDGRWALLSRGLGDYGCEEFFALDVQNGQAWRVFRDEYHADRFSACARPEILLLESGLLFREVLEDQTQGNDVWTAPRLRSIVIYDLANRSSRDFPSYWEAAQAGFPPPEFPRVWLQGGRFGSGTIYATVHQLDGSNMTYELGPANSSVSHSRPIMGECLYFRLEVSSYSIYTERRDEIVSLNVRTGKLSTVLTMPPGFSLGSGLWSIQADAGFLILHGGVQPEGDNGIGEWAAQRIYALETPKCEP